MNRAAKRRPWHPASMAGQPPKATSCWAEQHCSTVPLLESPDSAGQVLTSSLAAHGMGTDLMHTPSSCTGAPRQALKMQMQDIHLHSRLPWCRLCISARICISASVQLGSSGSPLQTRPQHVPGVHLNTLAGNTALPWGLVTFDDSRSKFDTLLLCVPLETGSLPSLHAFTA